VFSICSKLKGYIKAGEFLQIDSGLIHSILLLYSLLIHCQLEGCISFAVSIEVAPHARYFLGFFDLKLGKGRWKETIKHEYSI